MSLRPRRYAALGLLGLLGLAGVVLLVWLAPPALYGYVPDPKDRAAAEASTRTGVIAGLAGLGALGSLAITARTYRLTEQGHITDRYAKAIEQLGSAKLDVRLGGVYALERIAVDSKRDHPTVVEVLSAFVREHSDPTHTDAEPTIAKVLTGLLHSNSEPTIESQPNGDTEKKPKPTTDVQAALTVLGRLPMRFGVSRGDLSDAQLAGAQLKEANLADAQLSGADLSRAQLSEADLSGARLVGANLSGAGLGGADLSGARLADADLSGAMVMRADLSGAGLGKANLAGAQLIKANLSAARLGGADLSDALLGGADLSRAQLTGTVLTGAQLCKVTLSATWPDGTVFLVSSTGRTSQEQLASRRHNSSAPIAIRQLGFRPAYNGHLAGQAVSTRGQRPSDNLMPIPTDS